VNELKRLLIDVDDCAAQFRPRYLNLVNDLLGKSKTMGDGIHIYRCERAFELTRAEEAIILGELAKPGFASTLDVTPGAQEAIEFLASKYEVVFVTAPLQESDTWAKDRRVWIRKYFGHVLEESSISTSHKHVIDGDYLIEDNIITAKLWKADRLSRCKGHRYIAPLLYSWPYNSNDDGITTLKSWEDIVRYLECP